MILHSLAVSNFRNLVEATYQFHPRANLFVGDNGQGKTNLLEAIYFLATTKSFRTPRVPNLIRIGRSTLFAAGELTHTSIRKSLSIGIEAGDERRRELLVNGQRVTLHQYLSTLPVFAYSSSRLEIIRGGPEERRRFLDRGIASLHPSYLRDLTSYQRALKQRNTLLQDVAAGTAKASALQPWDDELLLAAKPIVEARRRYTVDLTAAFRRIVEAHDYHVRSLEIVYCPNVFETGAGDLESNREILRRLRPRELGAGFSLLGPHRDNIELRLEGRAANDVLSAGELKITVLFLKLSKITLYRTHFEDEPLFLFDDVDAELDLGIIERLLEYIFGSTQLFTTSAKAGFLDLLNVGSHRRFELQKGRLEVVADR